MRDPRSGFAKSFRNGYAGLGQERLFGALIVLVSCQACAGLGDSATPAAAPTTRPSATSAAATARPRAIALRYVAPADCPDVDEYWRHVRARSTIASVEPSGAPTPDSPDVRVELEPAENGWAGRLTIAGALELDREVRGDRCEDVVEALALITVLRLEGADASSSGVAGAGRAGTGSASSSNAARPGGSTAAPSSDNSRRAPEIPANDARTPSASAEGRAPATPSESAARAAPVPSARTPPPEAASPSAPTAPAPATPPAAPSAIEPSAVEPSASDRQAAGVARDAEAQRSEAPSDAASDDGPERGTRGTDIEPSDDGSPEDAGEPTPPSEPWQWPSVRAGVAAQAGYATVPARALQGLLEGELRFGETMSSWATTLSIAYTRGASETEEAELDITLFTAELALCPPSFVDAASLWIRACGGVRGGGVHVIITPSDPSQSPADVWRPWLAVGPSLQLGVPLSQRWALRGVLELAVQLVRDRFYVDDTRIAEQPERIRLYRPDAASFEFGLGLGYTF